MTLLSPVLNEKELELLKMDNVLKAKTLRTYFNISKGIPGALQSALDSLCRAADDAVRAGSQLIILSDRNNHLVSSNFLSYLVYTFENVIILIL